MPIRLWEQKWKIELNKDSLNWANIWNNVHTGVCNYNVQSSIWEMIHINYIGGYILKQMHNSDAVYKLFNKLERQKTHIL